MEKNYISFERLCKKTDLSKYRIRYFQGQGYFREESDLKASGTTEPDGLYDARWIDVWEEAEEYARAGLRIEAALKEATKDVFGSR